MICAVVSSGVAVVSGGGEGSGISGYGVGVVLELCEWCCI